MNEPQRGGRYVRDDKTGKLSREGDVETPSSPESDPETSAPEAKTAKKGAK